MKFLGQYLLQESFGKKLFKYDISPPYFFHLVYLVEFILHVTLEMFEKGDLFL